MKWLRAFASKLPAMLLEIVVSLSIGLIFIVGVVSAAGYVAWMRIIDEDTFFPIVAGLGFVLGPLCAWWITRKLPEGDFKHCLMILFAIVLLVLTPVVMTLINVKLDFGHARERVGHVIVSSGRPKKTMLPIRNFDDPHTFFWLQVKPETCAMLSGGGEIRMTTRPGLLGFEWIETVHEPWLPARPATPDWTPEPAPVPGDMRIENEEPKPQEQ